MGLAEQEDADQWLDEVAACYADQTNGKIDWAIQVLKLQHGALSRWYADGISPDDAAKKAAELNLERPRRRKRSRCGH
jgi:hypothetical protein